MRFTVTAGVLASAAGYVAKVIASRPSQPVLSGVLMRAEGGQVSLYGIDVSTSAWAQAAVPADIEQEGVVLVSGKMFAEICSHVKNTVELSLDGHLLRVKAGSAKFALPVMDAATFPAPQLDPVPVTGTLPASELLAAVETVAIATDDDSALTVLGTVYLEFDGRHITMAATDRYRLASREVTWTSTLRQPRVLLINAKALHDAVKGLAKDGESVSVSLVGNDTLVLSGLTRTARVTSTDAEYPAWRALLPKQYAGTAVVSAKGALEVVNRVSIVRQGADPVAVTFTPDRLLLACGRPNESGSADELEAAYTGEPMTVYFNPEYLREGLAACGDQDVAVHLVSPTKPAVITPQDGSPYSYLVMTVRPEAVSLAA